MNWAIESIDLKAAFLKGDGLEQDVFIHSPKKISKPGKLLKFVGYLVCMMKLVKHELINKLEGKVSKFAKAYFLWYHEDGTVNDTIALHVDDFIYSGANK